MTLPLIIYNLSAVLFTLVILYFLYRHQDERVVERSVLLIIVELSFLLMGGILFPMDGFGRIQLMAWGLFLHFPVYLVGNIAILRRQNKSYTNFLIGIFALILIITGFWMVQHQLYATMPKYVLRMAGEGASRSVHHKWH